MSLVEDLGGNVHAVAEDLPVGPVTVAAQRLRVGLELLQWARQTSIQEVGVAHLANATEHLEEATYALRVAQDSLASYLAALGLDHDAAPTADHSWREGLAGAPEPPAPPPADRPDATPLRHWWTARVDALTGHSGQEPAADRSTDPATEPAELLRRVADPVRSGDRERLRAELRKASVPVGLGLSALTAPVARHLAAQVLGHEPSAQDLDGLTRPTRDRMRQLLPGLPDDVLATAVARVCRVAPERAGAAAREAARRNARAAGQAADEESGATHPTDSAVAGAVLVGVLLARLGRGPDDLQREIDAARAEAAARRPPVRPTTASPDHRASQRPTAAGPDHTRPTPAGRPDG